MISVLSSAVNNEAISATLSQAQAAEVNWQCVVVGAGPSGAALAIRLARHGLRVLLVDRNAMPRPKVCGCCLSLTALKELEDLGMLGNCVAQKRLPNACYPVPLTAVVVMAAGRSARIPLPGGGCLSREALDSALVRQAIDAGAAWLPGLSISAITEDCSSISPGTVGGVTLSGRIATSTPAESLTILRAERAVIAAGLTDQVRVTTTEAGLPHSNDRQRFQRRVAPHSRMGIGATLPMHSLHLPAGELMMVVGQYGYCGLVRLEDGRIDLAAAIDRRLLENNTLPACAVRGLLQDGWNHTTHGSLAYTSGQPDFFSYLLAATFRATPPLTHASALVAGSAERIFRVGDASGYVEPFTGEGMGWALCSARVFAEALVTGTAETVPLALRLSSVAANYRAAHKTLFAANHTRCLRVARSLRYPAVVSLAIRLAQIAPWAARRILPMLISAG